MFLLSWGTMDMFVVSSALDNVGVLCGAGCFLSHALHFLLSPHYPYDYEQVCSVQGNLDFSTFLLKSLPGSTHCPIQSHFCISWYFYSSTPLPGTKICMCSIPAITKLTNLMLKIIQMYSYSSVCQKVNTRLTRIKSRVGQGWFWEQIHVLAAPSF